MSISMSMVGITSTSRRHKGGRDYDRCGNREATFLNPQNFANTIGKPTVVTVMVLFGVMNVTIFLVPG
jgi:hypothetical protein